jgi:hypothetical protein
MISAATHTDNDMELQDLRNAVEELADCVESDLRGNAERVAHSLPPGSLLYATILLLQMEARHIWRMRTLAREREAERQKVLPTDPPAAAATDDSGHRGEHPAGSWAKQNRCKCPACDQGRVEKEAFEEKWRAKRLEITIQYEEMLRKELRMEWTAELLEAGFALPSGETVSWGEATADQHQSRIDMLRANVTANAEASVRHGEALARIIQSGKATLNEAMGVTRNDLT